MIRDALRISSTYAEGGWPLDDEDPWSRTAGRRISVEGAVALTHRSRELGQ